MLRFLVIFSLFLFPVCSSAKNVALVVGNADYKHVTTLSNPINDASAVSQAFSMQGFEVWQATNSTRSELYDTLRAFRQEADNAEVAVIYYAGHGVEIGGQNYVIPVDARLADERDADTEMIEVDVLLRQISGASKLKMLVLDACRDNPFLISMKRSEQTRSVGRGLAGISHARAATLIAFAAAAGEVTPDGVDGENSPFTAAFVKALAQPPADVRLVLGAVRDELMKTVPGASPFVYSSLGKSEIVINPNSEAAPADKAQELENQIVKDFVDAELSATVEGWHAFLEKYANSSEHAIYKVALRSHARLQRDLERERSETLPEETQASLRDTTGEDSAISEGQVPALSETPKELAPEQSAPEQEEIDISDLYVILQEELKARGCYRGKIDGIIGSASKRAIQSLTKEESNRFVNVLSEMEDVEALLSWLSENVDTKCESVATTSSRKRAANSVKPSPAPTAKPAKTCIAYNGKTFCQ